MNIHLKTTVYDTDVSTTDEDSEALLGYFV